MAIFAWRDLLDQWSHELLHDPVFLAYHADTVTPEIAASGWAGFPGATEQQIAALEQRLGTTIPPSYREFLAISNGWRQTSPFIYRLWSTEEVEWFATRNQAWIDAYVEPYAEEDRDEPIERWIQQLQSTLEISDEGDAAIYLLNPLIMTSSGEWEAWFFANWVAGERRYPSFWDLMVEEHETYLRLRHGANA